MWRAEKLVDEITYGASGSNSNDLEKKRKPEDDSNDLKKKRKPEGCDSNDLDIIIVCNEEVQSSKNTWKKITHDQIRKTPILEIFPDFFTNKLMYRPPISPLARELYKKNDCHFTNAMLADPTFDKSLTEIEVAYLYEINKFDTTEQWEFNTGDWFCFDMLDKDKVGCVGEAIGSNRILIGFKKVAAAGPASSLLT
tara:strand:- start:2553 stop:3140 length:588 start_codon:yes stop_codon:yes gene_type:complete